ncbi:MAG: periplasmic sensor signal transduction histidine kinase, partial [Comamonadaceae bacterium]
VTTSELFREKQCQVTVVVPDTPLMLMADPDRLTQVMLNLLANAAKFVPEPGGRVDVSLSSDDVAVTVRVVDNGPGVSDEQQALIFEKFRQGGDALNRPPGTGLGLPISRQIVEHFGGRLWLESAPGQGAVFCFELPLEQIYEETNNESKNTGGR